MSSNDNGKKNEQEQLALSALIENSNDIALVKDLDRRIVSGNKNFVRASVFDSLSQLIGKTDSEILGIPEDQEPVHSYMLDDLTALKLAAGEFLLREENIPSADGQTRTYLTRKFPIYNESRVIGIGVITADVTEQRQSEERSKSQNTLLAMVMETSPVGIATVDMDGGITYANSRAEQILGIKKDDITSRKYNDPEWRHTDIDGGFFPDEKLPFSLVKTTGQTVYNIQHGIIWPDGRSVILSVNASPIRDKAGRLSGMVATFEDITEKINNEKLIVRQLEEKTVLLKEVHHRIKNNIASIEGLLSMQLQSLNNPEAISALQNAIARVQGMRILYDKLLVSSDYQEVSIKAYTESLIDSIASVFHESGKVTIEKRLADFSLSTKSVFCVGIIINELLTNIFKYAFIGRPGGHILIMLEKSENRVTLTIQDDGLGIDPGFDINTSQGFGLTIVKMLSEQLGGTFTIENNNGTRSLLTF